MQAGGLKDRGKRPWLARLGEEEEQGWHSGDGEFCEGLGRLLRAGEQSPGVRKGVALVMLLLSPSQSLS